MKFKLDENLPTAMTSVLTAAGHDAISATAQGLGGKADQEIAAVCRDEGRALITLDVGFSDIRTYPPKEYSGIIVLRLRRQDIPHLRSMIVRLLPLFADNELAQTLWIVDEQRVRFRK